MEEDHEKEVKEIIDGVKCPKNFRCYFLGPGDLCKARRVSGAASYVECLEENPQECVFSASFGDEKVHVCCCPLRLYIAEKLNK